MLDFVDHRFDMLLATTIIESGLDIPNANTMFIDEADRYGLADLHQLRGRVGRYKHRAYCYLLVDPNKHLSPSAAKRLRAIEEFSDMGAGFAIAMRDLEIRGAGNILGTEQSGHIAAVGYELYCALLEQAVRRLKRLPPQESRRSGRRPARRGLHPPHLCARHAAEDRSLPPPGAGDRAGRAGRFPRRVGATVSARRRRRSSTAVAGRVEDRRAPLGHLGDPHGGPIRGARSTPRGRRSSRLAAQSGGRLRIVDARTAYLPMNGRHGDAEAVRTEVKSLLQAE